MNLQGETLNEAYFTVINVKVSFRTEYVDRPGLEEKNASVTLLLDFISLCFRIFMKYCL